MENKNLVLTSNGNYLNIKLIAEFKSAENGKNNNQSVRLCGEKDWIEVQINFRDLYNLLNQ